jgi:hypothetical protein
MNQYQKEEKKRKLYRHTIGMTRVTTKNEWINGRKNDRQNHESHFLINLEILSPQKPTGMVFVQ